MRLRSIIKAWEFFRRRSNGGLARPAQRGIRRDIHSGRGEGGGYPHMPPTTYAFS